MEEPGRGRADRTAAAGRAEAADLVEEPEKGQSEPGRTAAAVPGWPPAAVPGQAAAYFLVQKP